MRTLSALAVVSVSMLACASAPPPAPSAPTGPASQGPTAGPATAAVYKAPGEAKVGDKSTCLISNEEFLVTATSPKVDYNGKTYYFCCPGCDAKFQADPAKYLTPPKS
jgi:YHS domain-containing protein